MGLKSVVGLFPANSQGRRKIVATLAGVCDRSVLANVLQLKPTYIANCVYQDTKNLCSKVTNDSGRSGIEYGHIQNAEGRIFMSFVMTEASMRSGQKPRKRGVTLYTEQPMYKFYESYRIEFVSLCITEASTQPQYLGDIPQRVASEHEANLWTAVWMSRQKGFDLLEIACRDAGGTPSGAFEIRF